jgi:hypothetical protein
MRDLLLKSEARKAINMLDVPEGERHRGKDWRAQLLASGVPKVPSKFGIKAGLSAGDGKPDEPESDVPPLRVANPVPPAWEDGDRPVRIRLRRRPLGPPRPPSRPTATHDSSPPPSRPPLAAAECPAVLACSRLQYFSKPGGHCWGLGGDGWSAMREKSSDFARLACL